MPEIMTFEVLDRPLWFHTAGLIQTASGYGRRLRSSYCLRGADKVVRRVYITQFSNAGTAWIVYKGEKYTVDIWQGDQTVDVDLSKPWGVKAAPAADVSEVA